MKISIRNMFGWLVSNSLIMSGVVNRAKKRALSKECIITIYFHNPSKPEFEFCVKWLIKNKFKFFSTSDIERIMQQDLPFPKGGVILTVDDGWQSNEVNVVELAKKYRVPVTIFVSTAPVEEGNYWWSYILNAKPSGLTIMPVESFKKLPNEERILKISKMMNQINLEREAMTVDQVKNAAESEYVTIGGHTHTHPILINCKDDEVYNELIISRQKLESWTGKAVHYFSYPNGDYGPREIEFLKKLKYRLAFSDDPKILTPDLLKENYKLPRFGFLEGASSAENICRIVGVWQPMMLKFNLKNITKKATPIFVRKANRTGLANETQTSIN